CVCPSVDRRLTVGPSRELDFGSRMLDFGSRMLDFGTLGHGLDIPASTYLRHAGISNLRTAVPRSPVKPSLSGSRCFSFRSSSRVKSVARFIPISRNHVLWLAVMLVPSGFAALAI